MKWNNCHLFGLLLWVKYNCYRFSKSSVTCCEHVVVDALIFYDNFTVDVKNINIFSSPPQKAYKKNINNVGNTSDYILAAKA